MLQAQHIAYRIGSATLLEDVSAAFVPGRINLVIGPNGAGKSTLIRILSGQLTPSAGAVRYGGVDVRQIPASVLARQRALLSQNIELAFPMKVSEVVMMGRYPHFSYRPSEQDHHICLETMQFFDIQGLSNRDYMTLSGGEMQRVHFARVAAQIWDASEESEPRYLLLDEPLTYLDIYYQIDFMDKLIDLVGRQHLVVTGVVHDLNLAAKYAGHLTLLQEGRIVAEGAPRAVLTEERIRQVYGLDVSVVDWQGGARLLF